MAVFNHYPPRQTKWAPVKTEQAVFDAGLRQHMRRVYNYMVMGLAVTGIVASLIAGSPTLTAVIFGTPLKWIAMLAPLVFIFVLSWHFDRLSVSALQILFWVFCGVMGLSMASIFLMFTGASVARVFFITAAMFAGVSLYGYLTQADLSRMGSFLFMGLLGLIIAGLVNLFLASSALHFALSVIGVLVFTGLTAYDTQRVKEEYAEYHGYETNSKLAIMGALSLYLNFVNLFQMLLQLLGNRE